MVTVAQQALNQMVAEEPEKGKKFVPIKKGFKPGARPPAKPANRARINKIFIVLASNEVLIGIPVHKGNPNLPPYLGQNFQTLLEDDPDGLASAATIDGLAYKRSPTHPTAYLLLTSQQNKTYRYPLFFHIIRENEEADRHAGKARFGQKLAAYLTFICQNLKYGPERFQYVGSAPPAAFHHDMLSDFFTIDMAWAIVQQIYDGADPDNLEWNNETMLQYFRPEELHILRDVDHVDNDQNDGNDNGRPDPDSVAAFIASMNDIE